MLCLARYGKDDKHHAALPNVSRETLAGMFGTTRSYAKFFINKFRKLGFIKYEGGLLINTSLLNIGLLACGPLPGSRSLARNLLLVIGC